MKIKDSEVSNSGVRRYNIALTKDEIKEIHNSLTHMFISVKKYRPDAGIQFLSNRSRITTLICEFNKLVIATNK